MQFEVQKGLPPYGPEALPFSATGFDTHSEGYVVKVVPGNGTEWIGNFQPGSSSFYGVIIHPNKQRLLVIAGGQAYVVDPNKPSAWHHFGGQIEFAERVLELDALLIGNGLWFELIGPKSLIWQSRRISWDGMQNLMIEGTKLRGSAWTFEPDGWYTFELDLTDGTVIGGSYNGPEAPAECPSNAF